MKKSILTTCLIVFWFLSGTAFAAIEYSIYSDEMSLNHSRAYYWGLDATDAQAKMDLGYTITSASLSIKSIDNWREPENDMLFLRLMDNPWDAAGLWSYRDSNSENVDYWPRWGEASLSLPSFSDENGTGPGHKDDYEYIFDTEHLNTLTSFIDNNGYIGFGIDPDCHYSYCGLDFKIQMSEFGTNDAVPEPGTLILFGTGLLLFAGKARSRFQKKE